MLQFAGLFVEYYVLNFYSIWMMQIIAFDMSSIIFRESASGPVKIINYLMWILYILWNVVKR